MKIQTFLLKTVLSWIAIVAVRFLGQAVVATKLSGLPEVVGWTLASNAIAASTLTFLALSSSWRGLRLALALSAVYYGIQAVNAIEGVVFLNVTRAMVTLPLLSGAIMVPVWMLVFLRAESETPRQGAPPKHSFGGWLWRFLLCDFGYLVLYFVAGLIVFPFVRDFYATRQMPSLQKIVALQLLLRGPLFVGLCLLLSRMACLPRLAGAMAVGVVFALLSGVVSLIVPNPFMPDAVRWAHFCEVTSSNCVFGAVAGWIYSARPAV
jgi:hypothetical protein